jgi:UDP-N-acetylglucosamine 3-dehydrogenase
MKRPVHIALVGAGEIGAVHAQAHAAVEGTRLAAICDVHPEPAKRLAGQVASKAVASFEEVLDDPTMEAVDLCVPNHLHRALAVRALEAGKHVLCEKPIALSLEDADAMLAAADRSGRFLMIGHVLRFWPEYVRAKEVVDAGQLGDPLLMSGRRMVSLLAGTPGSDGWRHDPLRSGGAVLDMQIHDLDIFCWLFGQPEAVVARGVRSEDGAWNHVFSLVDFAGGRKGFIEASFMLRGNPLDISFRILGTQRSIEYVFRPAEFALHQIKTDGPREPVPSLMLYEWGQEPQPLYTPVTDSFRIAFQAEVQYFVECVRTGTVPSIGTAQQARLALQLAMASQRSCQTGEVVATIGRA